MSEIEDKARALFLGKLDSWVNALERDKATALRQDSFNEAKWLQYLIDLINAERKL